MQPLTQFVAQNEGLCLLLLFQIWKYLAARKNKPEEL